MLSSNILNRYTSPRRDWYRLTNLGKGEAELFIYDAIGGSFWDEGVGADDFVRELRGLDASHIHLRINSPGGVVSDAVAIRTALIEHPATITTHVDGIAASAASWVGLAAESVVMAKGSRMMIHDPISFAWGNRHDLRKEAEVLDGFADDIANMYAERAGGSRQEWLDRMREETWYSDRQAVDAGLADEVAGDPPAENTFDRAILALFRNTPAELLAPADGGTPSVRAAERALRDEGFTHSQARAILRRGWDAMQGSGGARSLEDLLDAIRAAS